ncbi:uncharacterized protein LOC116350635 [Contarinia nasturtii]|uniref:uncharacterized protein LOC116350635 n=1 Tax=Contarinia nasturtii TaxID=265458 RepID=UPI0012D3A3BD|nr:uncharacterized protein LOC116350635 [Contarinia nasturtii]
MGVRGLKTFFEREKLVRPIETSVEINKWREEHPGQKPILVIDFYNLCFSLTANIHDSVCGGDDQKSSNSLRKILSTLKDAGCSLVFFMDLNVQEGKIDEWLSRRNAEFQSNIILYDRIGLLPLSELFDTDEGAVLGSTLNALKAIAKTYGEFHYSSRYECDLETAQYATQNNALAILSSDTDFLIFDGPWKNWSIHDLHFYRTNEIRTIEFDRNGLAKVCSLSRYQLPLFATLLGNDFTKKYEDQLEKFYNSLGPFKYRIRNVAAYARKVGSEYLSDLDIRRLSQHVFGKADKKIQQVIRDSLDSYNIDIPSATIDDPLEEKLLNTDMYEPYTYLMGTILDIILDCYDMRGCKPEANYPLLIADWYKRNVGILRQRNNDSEFTFTILMKKSIDVGYKAYTETPIYPNFSVPCLDDLYLQIDSVDNMEIRWKILAFIMSLSENTISAIKILPTAFRLISTTLFALVKHGLIQEIEADGILHTEYMNSTNDIKDVDYPTVLVASHIRAAHLYKSAHSHIQLNFAIAGLLSFIKENLQFKGLYFQYIMSKIIKMNATERESFFAPIKTYRIYSSD